jgi:hypothetical protein
VANGTTDDVEVNARIFCLGDRHCARIHVPDTVRNSGFAGDGPPFPRIGMRCVGSPAVLIYDENTNALVNRNLL